MKHLLKNYVKLQSYHCSIVCPSPAPGCTSRRGKGEACSLHFYHLPSNPDVRQCWLVSIKKSIVVSDYTRICSLHFIGGEKTVDNPITNGISLENR